MAGPFKQYFDAWALDDPKGTSLGEVTDARDKRIQDQHNGVGFGHFVINKHSDQIDWVSTGNLIRVRIEDGGPFAWNDPRYKFAFYIEDLEGEIVSPDGDGGEDWTRQGRGIIVVTDRLIWWNESFISDDGSSPLLRKDHWHFPDDRTWGHILNRMVNEWNGRGPSPPAPIPDTLDKDFGVVNDSGGDAWQDIEGGDEPGEYDIPFGEHYLQTLNDAVEANVDVHMSPAFVLSAWNEDGRGTDKTATVVFRKGWNIRESASKQVHATQRGTRALVEGKDATYAVATDTHTASAESGIWGRREIFAEYPRTKNKELLKWAGKRALKRSRKRADGPPTIGVTSYDDIRFVDQGDGGSPEAFKNLVPWDDYDVADLVKVAIPGDYTNNTQQIVEIALNDTDAGYAEVTLTFDDVPFNPSAGSGNGMAGGTGGGGGGGGKCDCPPQRPHPPFCLPQPEDTVLIDWDWSPCAEVLWEDSFYLTTGNAWNAYPGWTGAPGCSTTANRAFSRNFAVSPGDVLTMTLVCARYGGAGGAPDPATFMIRWNDSAGNVISDEVLYHGIQMGGLSHEGGDHGEYVTNVITFGAAPAGAAHAQLKQTEWSTFFVQSVRITLSAEDPNPDGFCVPEGSYDPDDPYDAPSSHGHDDLAEAGHTHTPTTLLTSWKAPVRAATTANGTLATAFEAGDTLDGVTLADGDRILIKNQTNAEENGIYIVQATGAPLRDYDMDDSGDPIAGAMVRVNEGTANADKVFGVTSNDPHTLDTDDIVWAEVSGGGGGSVDYAEDADISTQAFGDSPAAGASTTEVAGANHKHGMPANPVTAHEADEFAHGDHYASVQVIFGDGTATIASGAKMPVRIPYDCEIVRWSLLADVSGAIVVDIWKDTYGNYPPTDADSITGGNEPEIVASGVKNQDTTLSGWTTALSEGDILMFNVDSGTSVKRVTLELRLRKT